MEERFLCGARQHTPRVNNTLFSFPTHHSARRKKNALTSCLCARLIKERQLLCRKNVKASRCRVELQLQVELSSMSIRTLGRKVRPSVKFMDIFFKSPLHKIGCKVCLPCERILLLYCICKGIRTLSILCEITDAHLHVLL